MKAVLDLLQDLYTNEAARDTLLYLSEREEEAGEEEPVPLADLQEELGYEWEAFDEGVTFLTQQHLAYQRADGEWEEMEDGRKAISMALELNTHGRKYAELLHVVDAELDESWDAVEEQLSSQPRYAERFSS